MSNRKDIAPATAAKPNKQPAIPADTYPADMEAQRGEPKGGDDKPGPKNPEPMPAKE